MPQEEAGHQHGAAAAGGREQAELPAAGQAKEQEHAKGAAYQVMVFRKLRSMHLYRSIQTDQGLYQ